MSGFYQPFSKTLLKEAIVPWARFFSVLLVALVVAFFISCLANGLI